MEKGDRFPHSRSSMERTLVTWHTGGVRRAGKCSHRPAPSLFLLLVPLGRGCLAPDMDSPGHCGNPPRVLAHAVSPKRPALPPNPRRYGECQIIVLEGALLPKRSSIGTAMLKNWPCSLRNHGHRLPFTDGLNEQFCCAILPWENELIDIPSSPLA